MSDEQEHAEAIRVGDALGALLKPLNRKQRVWAVTSMLLDHEAQERGFIYNVSQAIIHAARAARGSAS